MLARAPSERIGVVFSFLLLFFIRKQQPFDRELGVSPMLTDMCQWVKHEGLDRRNLQLQEQRLQQGPPQAGGLH